MIVKCAAKQYDMILVYSRRKTASRDNIYVPFAFIPFYCTQMPRNLY